jgi:hypothetical protein
MVVDEVSMGVGNLNKSVVYFESNLIKDPLFFLLFDYLVHEISFIFD